MNSHLSLSSRWLGFFSLILALAITHLDKTIVPVALPAIQNDFQTTDLALQWCVNAYLLSTTVFILVAGKISDRIGHKKALLLGNIAFTLSSIFCALSPNIGCFIAARVSKGIGAALILTAQPALLGSIFPSDKTGRTVGFNTSISSFFMILGPLIGGYLVDFFSWRSIFWLNLPLSLLSLFLGMMFIPHSRTTEGKIDRAGFLYFTLFSTSLIFLLMQGNAWGWNSWKIGICALCFLCSLVFLLRRESQSDHPFLDLALFKNPLFVAINLLIGLSQFMLMINVYRTIYFQTVLNYTPSEAGYLLFLSCIPVLFFSQIAGLLSDKMNPAIPVILGFLLLFYSFFSLACLPHLIAPLIAFGIGLPLILTPTYSAVFPTIPPNKLGVAFGMIGTLRTFSAALGVALIAWFTNTLESHHVSKPLSFSALHFAFALLVIVEFLLIFFLYRRRARDPLYTP
jgi:EmrB/QacA subfamily drug resistance transporter